MAARRLLGGEGGAAPRPLLPRPASGGRGRGSSANAAAAATACLPALPEGCSAPRIETNGPQPGDALRGLGEGFPRDEDAAGRREPESEARSEGSGAACPRPASGNLKLPLVPGNSRRAFPAPPRWSCSQEEGGGGTRGAAPGCSWVLSIRVPG